jgi:hypothetical protein
MSYRQIEYVEKVGTLTVGLIGEDYIVEQSKWEHVEEGIAVTATEVKKPAISSGQCHILHRRRLSFWSHASLLERQTRFCYCAMWLSESGLTLCNSCIVMRGLKAEQVEGRGGMWAVSDIEEHLVDFTQSRRTVQRGVLQVCRCASYHNQRKRIRTDWKSVGCSVNRARSNRVNLYSPQTMTLQRGTKTCVTYSNIEVPARCTYYRVYFIWWLLYMFRVPLSPI